MFILINDINSNTQNFIKYSVFCPLKIKENNNKYEIMNSKKLRTEESST